MKYGRDSNVIPGMKEFYTIVSLSTDQLFRRVSVTLALITPEPDGTAKFSLTEQYFITDRIEYIIDPNWDSNSNPPKPEGFDPIDPSTWGDLSLDDIPKIPNPEKLYATRIIDALEKGERVDERVFDALVELGYVPKGNGWRKL